MSFLDKLMELVDIAKDIKTPEINVIVEKSKCQYRIFQEGDFWRYWISFPHLSVKVISTKSFVSKELAKENMGEVLGEMGWQIKAMRTTPQ